MARSYDEILDEIKLKSQKRREEEDHKAAIRKQQQAEKHEDSKALLNHKSELAAADRQEKHELDVRSQAELAKLNTALTPEQLGHQYDHYVRVSNIDLQAFDHRENLQALLDHQKARQRHEHRQEEIAAEAKGALVEIFARQVVEGERHEQDMEKARLAAELEVKIFQEKHQFLHELYAKSNEADRKRLNELFREFELDQPYEAKGHDQPDEPHEP